MSEWGGGGGMPHVVAHVVAYVAAHVAAYMVALALVALQHIWRCHEQDDGKF